LRTLVYVVVPVAQYEPESQITKSIECLKELEAGNFTLEVYYVIETFPGDKRNLHQRLPDNFEIMLRTHRGRKAGGLNDFLSIRKNTVNNADYLAIFDVDNRPAKDYIVKCIASLENHDSAVSSSGCRFITNKSNILTKITSIQYCFVSDLYLLLSRSDSFMMFQGAGVLKGSFLEDEKFDEEASCTDLDLTARAYLKGKVAVFTDTTMGEQAPTTLKDLYHQRVRWYRCNVENLNKYLMPMIKAPIPFTRKISWFCLTIGAFFMFVLSPITTTLYLAKVFELSDTLLDFVKIFVGLFMDACFMTVCGIVALIKHATSSKLEWKPNIRSDV
jgi:cellulose synthase/poly-beta-1,6-N-acetylglucosamine synthase-like glycosyltransferase